MIRLTTTIAVVALSFLASPAGAVVYCKEVGVPKGCIAKPAVEPHPGVGAPGVGVEPRPGVGAPGVGVEPYRGVGAPGVGVGAPGAGVEAGNRGGPVDRAGRR